MKKITACVMIMVLLLTGCSAKGERGEVSENSETPKTEVSVELSKTEAADSEQTAKSSEAPEVSAIVESSETDAADNQEKQETEIGRKIKPLVAEKIDISKQGVGMPEYTEISTEIRKGDDDSCYYFRNEGKGKNKKIVFYKNNGIKVCETTMKKSFEKGKYYISSFVKYGENFFVVLKQTYGYHTILTTVEMATGKWGKTIKFLDDYESYIIYNNKFYCIYYGEITVYDLSGTKTGLGDLCPQKSNVRVYVQCIVDDKIYYVKEKGEKIYTSTGIVFDNGTTKIMRCSLDGSEREELFECSRISWEHLGCLKVDEDCMYLLLGDGGYNLMCIPLYGGKIKGIAKVGGYFELSENSIFFYSSSKSGDKIYKVDKDLGEKSKAVTEAYYYQYSGYTVLSAPFYYADGHLMVQGYNKKERKIVNAMLHDEDGDYSLWVDAMTNYAPDWYWVSEDGEIEDTIKGTGVKKKWKNLYEKWWG